MALSSAEVDRVVTLLERESESKVARVLRTASSLLDWLADVIDTASEMWRKLKKFANEIWRNLTDIFL